jgi:hypothetical protein
VTKERCGRRFEIAEFGHKKDVSICQTWRDDMTVMPRALLTLLAAAGAGALLWVAAQFNSNATGGYWAAMGVIAAGGLLLGLAQGRASGYPPLALPLVFVPIAVVTLWVIIVAEPVSNTFRSHLRGWDSDLGISSAVHDIGVWNGVLALGVGLVLGFALEPAAMRRRATAAVPTVTPTALETAPAEPVVADGSEATPQGTRVGRPAGQH